MLRTYLIKIMIFWFGIFAIAMFADHIAFGASYTERDVDVLLQRHQSTPPTTPAAGKVRLYSKSDNKLYILDSTAAESEVGSASGTEDNTASTLMRRSANSTTKISAIDFEKYSSAPAAPDAGFIRLYCKDDSTCYAQDENGTESGLGSGGGGSGESVAIAVNQTTHGFDVGDIVYRDSGGTFELALADADSTSEVMGMVSEDTDADNFVYTKIGRVTGLSGLTDGTTYFLSPTVAGGYTATAPTAAGQIFKPLFTAVSTTAVDVIDRAGVVIESQGSVGNATRVFGFSYGAASDPSACATNTTCTIYRQWDNDGNTDTITSIINGATAGRATVTITSGRCSSPPVCTLSMYGDTNAILRQDSGITSTTSFIIQGAATTTGSAIAVGGSGICTCPR